MWVHCSENLLRRWLYCQVSRVGGSHVDSFPRNLAGGAYKVIAVFGMRGQGIASRWCANFT